MVGVPCNSLAGSPLLANIVAFQEFQLAFSIWVVQANLSRANYKKLLEVLFLLSSIDQIFKLPAHFDTLRANLSKCLPLLPTDKRNIPVDQTVQPTQGAKTQGAKPGATSDPITEQRWFNPISLFHSILSSNLATEKMHFGMAEYVDEPVELWHSRSWGSSVRTTSGDFARISNGPIIFPGDFVEFPPLQASLAGISFTFGRVIFIGRDRRQASATKDLVVVTLQAVIYPNEIPDEIASGIDFHRRSLVLLEDNIVEVATTLIISKVDIEMCYHAANRKSSRIDWVFNLEHQSLRPATKLHPLRAELEVASYGRAYLESLASVRTMAVPMLLFIDGFGVHRNMYRSLKGFYMTPASLSYVERRRVCNTFTLTLGPHGASMQDVVQSFETKFQQLERGVLVPINGERVLMSAFVLCYTGDMPQQAANCGFLAHNAHIGCRICRCPKEKRGDLQYDIILNGRYHYDVVQQRKEGQNILASGERDEFWRSHGLQPEPCYLQTLTPALDLVLSRAFDTPHSEWKGLGRLLQDLLFEVILTPSAQRKYSSAFRKFLTPSHWPRIQNPKTHRGSWSLSELGLAVILTPLVLRCNAREDWIRPNYGAKAVSTLAFLQPANGESAMSPLDLIVCAYSIFSAAVSAVSTHTYMPHTSLRGAILNGRCVFQALIRTTSYSTGRFKEWKPKLSLPNVHIGLHLPEFAVEYGHLTNTTSLTGEKKHK